MPRPSSAASRFAVSIRAGARSDTVTVETARAARDATAPVPVATSSHISSGFGSSTRTRWSWMPASSAAMFSNGADPQAAACCCFSASKAMPGQLRFVGFLFLRACGQLVARAPQRREEIVVDHLAEHLDRRPLRADDLVADDARND